MRILAGFGALVFLYLALIPAGLIYSTIDSACAGEACETSVLSKVAFTSMYAVCLIAVLGTAGLFAHYAARGTLASRHRLPQALSLTGIVIGLSVFVLFLVAYPLGGAIALALASAGYLLVRLRGGPGEDDGGGGSSLPRLDGQAPTNGHSPNGHRTLRRTRL